MTWVSEYQRRLVDRRHRRLRRNVYPTRRPLFDEDALDLIRIGEREHSDRRRVLANLRGTNSDYDDNLESRDRQERAIRRDLENARLLTIEMNPRLVHQEAVLRRNRDIDAAQEAQAARAQATRVRMYGARAPYVAEFGEDMFNELMQEGGPLASIIRRVDDNEIV